MKIIKNTSALILTLIVAMTALLVPATASAAKIEKAVKTVGLYQSATQEFTYSKWHKFKVKVTNNKKHYIDASLNFDVGDGEYYSYFALVVTGLKKTPAENPPVAKVYYKTKSGKTVTLGKVSVKVKGKKPIAQNFKNVTLNPGTLKPSQKLKGNFLNVEERISDKSVVKLDYNSKYTTKDIYNGTYSDRGYVKGLKKGTATVSYWLKGYNVKLGEYKVRVKDTKTTINKKYKTVNLKFYDGKANKYYDRNQFYTALVLKNYHADAVYTTKIDDKSILSAKTIKKGKVSPNTNELLSAKKTGTTKVTIFEKLGKAKKTKVGTIKVKVSAATMADIVEAGDREHTMAGVYFMCIVKGETVDGYESVRLSWLEMFKESDYTIKLETNAPDVFKIDDKGMVTRISDGTGINEYIKITITFKDGSVFTTKNHPESDPSANVG